LLDKILITLELGGIRQAIFKDLSIFLGIGKRKNGFMSV